MSIEILAVQLKIPNLQSMVDDVRNNYINRPATKKWILFDYPEKHIAKCDKDGKKKRLSIPSALRSFFTNHTIEAINESWHKNYPDYA